MSAGPALFKPFSWLPEALERDAHARFAADSKDAWRGVETCLQLVFGSDLDRLSDDERVSPILGLIDTERLMRLAILTARTWGQESEDHVLSLTLRAMKNGNLNSDGAK